MKNRNFLNSFTCAKNGFVSALKSEYNLRFDISIMLSVIYFAVFFGLTAVQWTVVVLVFSVVLCAELLNTAIENAVDTATKEYSETAKCAKDTAAAAVFVCAGGAVVCAGFIFNDIQRWVQTLKVIFSNPVFGALFCALAISDIICLFYRRKGI